jgi:hypothetical protein
LENTSSARDEQSEFRRRTDCSLKCDLGIRLCLESVGLRDGGPENAVPGDLGKKKIVYPPQDFKNIYSIRILNTLNWIIQQARENVSGGVALYPGPRWGSRLTTEGRSRIHCFFTVDHRKAFG